MADGNNKKQLGDFTRDFKQRGETFVLVDQSPQRCDFGGRMLLWSRGRFLCAVLYFYFLFDKRLG